MADPLVFWRGRGVQAFAEGALYLSCQRVHGQDRGQRCVPLNRAVGQALVPQVFDVLSGLAEHVLTLRVLVLQVLELRDRGRQKYHIVALTMYAGGVEHIMADVRFCRDTNT